MKSESTAEYILDITNLSKTYSNDFVALDQVNLQVRPGEVFCLLGANGAGKTTLINTVCGLVQPSSGSIYVDGHEAWDDYRAARALLSLVPQEVMLDPFITVLQTVQMARGYFGRHRDDAYLQEVLESLHLWNKRNNKVQELSGGMKRRVLIAKALMNEPKLLFLDEPTAGVDVELRRGLWGVVQELKARNTTIFLTTHYLEEAEKHADRIGFIAHGKLYFVKKKADLMAEYPGMSLEDIYVELTKQYE